MELMIGRIKLPGDVRVAMRIQSPGVLAELQNERTTVLLV
jgi:hypothetical protein